MITPHGGSLINKALSKREKEEILLKLDRFKRICIDEEKVKEVKNIAKGAYSPLEGYLREDDFKKVVAEMRLASGVVWPIPIVLDVSEGQRKNIENEKTILLADKNNNPVALLKDIEIYGYSKKDMAQNVYRTLDKNHPGVNETFSMGEHLVGGEIALIDETNQPFPEYNLSPRETREMFEKKGWKTIAAFQTRNVPHRGHEFLQKHALTITDGLLLHPVIGKKKTDDFKDEFILSAYELLIGRYHEKGKVCLSILPLKMRYAGPKEAVFHAIVRKNFGCTHFIIGRDHAGVGNYYGPYDAQNIFENFGKDEIGVELIKCPETVFCKQCNNHVFVNACSHAKEEKLSFSGTKMRESIIKQEQPPFYVIRPEIYFMLSNSNNPLVDGMYQEKNNQKGFTLWFTGFSQAGKTTIADAVYTILKDKGVKVERLDGDIVRKSLSADLGFSKQDREENLRRVSSVAKMFSQNGIGVIASFISPYRQTRQELRENIPNFIEVFANAPIEVCEKRDTKGLYKKARAGEIENFTGISDPYEPPLNPEIELKTDIWPVAQCAEKVVNYLSQNKYI